MNRFDFCHGVARSLQVPFVLLASLEDLASPYFVNTLFFYEKGKEGKAFSYCPDVAPCLFVYNDGEYLCRDNLMGSFPKDQAIQKMELQFYCGIRIDDEEGKPLGHLAIFDHCYHKVNPEALKAFEDGARKLLDRGNP